MDAWTVWPYSPMMVCVCLMLCLLPDVGFDVCCMHVCIDICRRVLSGAGNTLSYPQQHAHQLSTATVQEIRHTSHPSQVQLHAPGNRLAAVPPNTHSRCSGVSICLPAAASASSKAVQALRYLSQAAAHIHTSAEPVHLPTTNLCQHTTRVQSWQLQ